MALSTVSPCSRRKRVHDLERIDAAAEVEGAGGLVEQQDGCFLGQGPGQDEALQLAARQRAQSAGPPCAARSRRSEQLGAHLVVLCAFSKPKYPMWGERPSST